MWHFLNYLTYFVGGHPSSQRFILDSLWDIDIWQKGPSLVFPWGLLKTCPPPDKISIMVFTSECHYNWAVLPLSLVPYGIPSPRVAHGTHTYGHEPVNTLGLYCLKKEVMLETSYLPPHDGTQLLDSGWLGGEWIFMSVINSSSLSFLGREV